jgi:hypothetical protein
MLLSSINPPVAIILVSSCILIVNLSLFLTVSCYIRCDCCLDIDRRVPSNTGSVFEMPCLKGIGALSSAQNNSFVYDSLYLCYFRCNWWESHGVSKNKVMHVNSIQEEFKSRLKLGNACYRLVQNLLSSRLLSKNLKGNYNFARDFIWVWNLVADIEGGTQTEGVWE